MYKTTFLNISHINKNIKQHIEIHASTQGFPIPENLNELGRRKIFQLYELALSE